MDKAKILVLYYSMYGNVFQMAKEVASVINEVSEAEAVIKKVPELLPDSVIQKNKEIQHAIEKQKDIPVLWTIYDIVMDLFLGHQQDLEICAVR